MKTLRLLLISMLIGIVGGMLGRPYVVSCFTSVGAPGGDSLSPDLKYNDYKDAAALSASITESSSAQDMAQVLTSLDQMLFADTEQEKVDGIKDKLIGRLRLVVSNDVYIACKAALDAGNTKAASDQYGKATEALALFPTGQDSESLSLSRELVQHHALTGTRLQTLQRLRYNHWAVGQIETAITNFHVLKSYAHPIKENETLVASLVSNISAIDPGILEPAVMDLYNYALDLTRSKVSEMDRISLAKQLTDAAVVRKTAADF